MGFLLPRVPITRISFECNMGPLHSNMGNAWEEIINKISRDLGGTAYLTLYA